MEWKHLDPKARQLFYIQSFSRLLFFWLPVVVTSGVFFFGQLGVAGIVLAIVWLMGLFVMSVWMPSLAYNRWAYALREGDLLIAQGVLFRSITAIPAQRIQHVDLKQGPLEQWMGLSRIQIYTASGLGADGVIPGVASGVAEALRDELVSVVGDDGV